MCSDKSRVSSFPALRAVLSRNGTRSMLHELLSSVSLRAKQQRFGAVGAGSTSPVEKSDSSAWWRFFFDANGSENALAAQVCLGSCSTLPGKQDVDIISFPVINPIVAVEWKKPSWQHLAISLWKDEASDFGPLLPFPSGCSWEVPEVSCFASLTLRLPPHPCLRWGKTPGA